MNAKISLFVIDVEVITYLHDCTFSYSLCPTAFRGTILTASISENVKPDVNSLSFFCSLFQLGFTSWKFQH